MNTPEYTPGDWYAVVSGGVVLLLHPSTPPALVRELWADAPADGGLARPLETLLRDGLSGLRPFAAVDLTGEDVHTALRGDVDVHAVRDGAEQTLTAPQVIAWTEDSLAGAEQVELRATDADVDPQAPTWPLVSGVVRAGRVVVRRAEEPTSSPAPRGVTPARGAGAARALAVEAEDDGSQAPTAVLRLPTGGRDGVSRAADEGCAAGAKDKAEDDEKDASPAPAGEHGRRARPVSLVPDRPDSGATEQVEAGTPGARKDEPEPAAPMPSGVVRPRTGARTVPAPAGPAEPPAAPEPTPAAGTTTPAQDPAPVPAPRPALVPAGADDDHDGLTILSGDLATIRQNLPSWAVSQSGQWPTVQDSEQVPLVPLPTGAVPFAEPAPVPAEQPRVMLSTGSSVPVDGLVLIGRSPQPDRVPEGVRFRMVMVPSPNQDISRTHAEVRVEDGRTLVTDLFSTNGVTLTTGDLPPRRITAGEPVAVQPGDVVDLGDGVTFTVEPGA